MSAVDHFRSSELNSPLKPIFAVIKAVLRVTIAATCGLVAGLSAGAIVQFCIKTAFNKPLPPWGWTTNIVLETTLFAMIGLLVCRFVRAPAQISAAIIIAAAVVIGLAFSGNEPIVFALLNLSF